MLRQKAEISLDHKWLSLGEASRALGVNQATKLLAEARSIGESYGAQAARNGV